jgi:hypothetical protein
MESKRGRPDPVELVDHRAQALLEAALALAPRADDAAGDRRRVTAAPLEIGQNGPLDHLAHLVRHARHHVDHTATHGTDQSRRGPAHLRDDLRALGDHCLAEVVLRHRAAPRSEEHADALRHLFVEPEAGAHRLGDRLARDVVVCRPEPAADDDRAGAAQRQPQRVDDAGLVVSDLRLVVRGDAGGGELFPDPRRVRVDDLAEQQLSADRHHLARDHRCGQRRITRRAGPAEQLPEAGRASARGSWPR